MKHEPPPRTHTADGPPPVVIHHEHEQTILARWLLKAIEKGTTFWLFVGGGVLALAVLGYFVVGALSGQTASSKAWEEEMLATTPEGLRKVAADYEDSPAAAWALYKAASQSYEEGMTRLPGDREGAAPLLSQAMEGYKAVEAHPNADPTVKRAAALGVARTHEARNEISDAIGQYEKVAKQWPDSDDAKTASARVKLLGDPDAIEFYKKFASYTPPKTPSLGPRGTNRIGELPFGHPLLDGPTVPAGPIGGVRAGATGSGELPGDVFQKPTPPTPKTDSNLPEVFPKEKDETATPK